MLTREQAIDEARRQKEALTTIGNWRRVLFLVTSVFVVLAAFGLQGSGVIFGLGIAAAVIAAISCLAMFIVNLSIRNGHRNVERILDSLKPAEPTR
ncbi:MAG: hypothetical protein K2O11_06385 [Oscillospiraceae bacterium]|nr:hypothetical protein [Oscillospiraceae bacterium]